MEIRMYDISRERARSLPDVQPHDFLRDIEAGTISLRHNTKFVKAHTSERNNHLSEIASFKRSSMKHVPLRDTHKSFDTMADIEHMDVLESWLDAPYDRSRMNTRNNVMKSIRSLSDNDIMRPRELRRTQSFSLSQLVHQAEASNEFIQHITCSICYNTHTTKKRSSCITTMSGFDYCTDCIASYLEVQIADANISKNGHVACMCRAANCSNSYSAQDITSRISNPATIEKYFHFAALRAVMLDPTKRWCPSNTCHEILTVPPGAKRIRCHACTTVLCLGCNGSHSRYTSCSMAMDGGFRRWKAHTNEGCKRCPSCRMYIEKNEGCQHMTCASCRHEFCWACQSAWRHGCSNNPNICKVHRFLNHSAWGPHPVIRTVTKVVGLPVMTGIGVGGVVTVAGVLIGGAAAAAGVILSISPIIGSYALYKRYMNSLPASDRWPGEQTLMYGIRIMLPFSSSDEQYQSCYGSDPQFMGITGRIERNIFIGYSYTIEYRGTTYNPLIYFVPNNVSVEDQLLVMPFAMIEVTFGDPEELPLAMCHFRQTMTDADIESSYFIVAPGHGMNTTLLG